MALTAGNSSPLTTARRDPGVARGGSCQITADIPKAKLIDWEIASIDLRTEGLLMAPHLRFHAFSRVGRPTRTSICKCRRFAARVAPQGARECGFSARQGVLTRYSAPSARARQRTAAAWLGHPLAHGRGPSQAVKEFQPAGQRAIVSIQLTAVREALFSSSPQA